MTTPLNLTAKSMLVELLAERITGMSSSSHAFVGLLTCFTTPDELFGPISVAGLKKDECRRITTKDNRKTVPDARGLLDH